MAEASPGASRSIGARTAYATRAALGRPAGRAVFAATTLGYLVVYLAAIGHLGPGTGGVSVTVAADAGARLLRPALGTFTFELVVALTVGPVTYLFSLNTFLGIGLAALVGLNLAVTSLVWRQPAVCGLGTKSAGAVAGLPALLSGAACCGPVLLIAVGLQATGLLLSVFEFLLPIAATLLVGSLLLVARRVDPDREAVGGQPG